MKEKNFKFKERYSSVISSMNDKQAGKFVKALTQYAFNGQVYTGKDTAIKSAFALVKVDLDMQNFFKEKGKIGYEVKEENKKKEYQKPMFTKIVANSVGMENFIKNLFNIADQTEGKTKEDTSEDVAK